MSSIAKLVHVDEHPLFISGLRVALEQSREFTLAGSGQTLHDAVALVQRHKPHIAILDINIPGNGLEAALHITRLHAATRIVFITASQRPEHMFAAIDSGALGYLHKKASASDVLDCLRAVMTGKRFIWPQNSENLLPVTAGNNDDEEQADGVYLPTFTQREHDVVRRLQQGHTNREIAAALGISEKTVKHHVTVILHKLRVRNRVEATRAMLRYFPQS